VFNYLNLSRLRAPRFNGVDLVGTGGNSASLISSSRGAVLIPTYTRSLGIGMAHTAASESEHHRAPCSNHWSLKQPDAARPSVPCRLPHEPGVIRPIKIGGNEKRLRQTKRAPAASAKCAARHAQTTCLKSNGFGLSSKTSFSTILISMAYTHRVERRGFRLNPGDWTAPFCETGCRYDSYRSLDCASRTGTMGAE
jgi:hypothetical protein